MAPISQSLSQAANRRVNRVLAPQLAQQTSYGAHQNAVIRAFANSLLGKLQPIAGQVGADYDAAIKQVGSLSGQAAQYLSGQNPTAAQTALTSSVGAPAAQQAQQAQQLGDTFQGGAGVLAFTGGTIPGSQLAGNKAAAMAQARTLPGIGALKGQQDLSSALWQQSQDRQKIEAQRPELVQQEEQQIQKTNLAEAAAKATAAYKTAQIKLGYSKLAQSAYDKAAQREETKAYHDSYLTHLQNGDTEQAAHNKALEAAGAARIAISQQNADTSAYNAQTSRINAATSANKPEDRSLPGGGIIRVYPDGTTKVLRKPTTTATGGLTASGLGELSSRATKLATQLATSKPPELHWDLGESTPIEGTGKTPASFADALAQTVALGPNTPAWRKKARQIVGASYASMRRKARTGAAAAKRANIPYDQALATAQASGKYAEDVLAEAMAWAYVAGPVRPRG